MQNEIKVAYIEDYELVITGYNGYIGSSIINEFRKLNKKFVLLPIKNIKNCNCFIHLAANVNNDLDTFKRNLELDLEVIKYCDKTKCYLIYASGNNVYPKMVGCDISTHFNINDYYSASKIVTELLLNSLFSFNYTILRIADVFGSGQRHGNFFKSIEQSIKNRSELFLYGRGLKIRNYIYIKDLVNLIFYFIKERQNGTYNVCYDEPLSIYQIIQKISILSGLKIKYVDYPIENELLDIRTMKPSKFSRFSYQFNMHLAIEDYYHSIIKGDIL